MNQIEFAESGEMEQDELLFRVTDLKQFVYCPRVLYYHTILPRVRPTTYKMEAGIAAHETAETRERRRTLRPYGLAEGERYFDVALYAPVFGLSGELDMLIDTGAELIPVDYKNARREGEHFRLQLYAYARMIAEMWPEAEEREMRRGFLYLLPQRRAVEVNFTAAIRRRFEAALKTMRAIAETERMPAPTRNRARCVNCEFRRFCNDVI